MDASWTPQGNTGALQTIKTAFTADEVAATPMPSPGTATPDGYAWIAAGGGDWGNAANWADLTTNQTPAGIAPGVKNMVGITGGAAALVVTGLGNAASLVTTGNVTLSGIFNVGQLGVGIAAADTTLTDTASLTAASASIVDGTLAATGAGRVTVSGTLTMGGAGATSVDDYQTLTASAGGKVVLGGLVLSPTAGFYTPAYVAADATSSIEVGTAGGAANGQITIDDGASLTGAGTIGSTITNNGTLIAQGSGLIVEGSIYGGGLTSIAAGATLDVTGTVDSVTFGGAGATLIVARQTGANAGTFPVEGGVSGFGPGDTIDL